jgi:hypothetical protein
LYWVEKDNPRGAIPSHPESDSQYTNWEYAVRKWVVDNGIMDSGSQTSLPVGQDDVHTSSKIPTVSIVAPSNNSILPVNKKSLVTLSINNSYPISKVEVRMNGVIIGRADNKVLNYTFTPSDFGISPGEYKLTVSVTDSVWNNVNSEVKVKVE